MVFSIPSIGQLIVFFLFFSRVIGIFISAPIFGSRSIPSRLKIIFAIVLAYIFFVLFSANNEIKYKDLGVLSVAMLGISELLIGLLIGFIGLMIFGVIQFSGSMIDTMTGMHIASVIDPMTREQQSLMGQLQYLIAVLLFLFFNGHHYIIHAVYYSFNILPLGTLSFKALSIKAFIDVFNISFYVGLQLAAPVIAILFLIDLSLGIISKGVPQMNVFLTGMPLKSLVGFVAIFACFSYFGNFFGKIPMLTFENIIYVLKSL